MDEGQVWLLGALHVQVVGGGRGIAWSQVAGGMPSLPPPSFAPPCPSYLLLGSHCKAATHCVQHNLLISGEPGVPDIPPPQAPQLMTFTAPPLQSGSHMSPPEGEVLWHQLSCMDRQGA